MARLVYGVGYSSVGEYKTSINNKHTRAYSTWKGMLRRCYSAAYKVNLPTYIDCTVSDEWHDFQNFAHWFYSQTHSHLKHHLDKDILHPQNKVYSAKTCALVPSQVNTVLNNCRACRGDLPQGVSYHKIAGKYRARINIKGKDSYLGVFDCIEEAYQTYKKAKEDNVKRTALEWRECIDDDVFQALMNWQLTE